MANPRQNCTFVEIRYETGNASKPVITRGHSATILPHFLTTPVWTAHECRLSSLYSQVCQRSHTPDEAAQDTRKYHNRTGVA